MPSEPVLTSAWVFFFALFIYVSRADVVRIICEMLLLVTYMCYRLCCANNEGMRVIGFDYFGVRMVHPCVYKVNR